MLECERMRGPRGQNMISANFPLTAVPTAHFHCRYRILLTLHVEFSTKHV